MRGGARAPRSRPRRRMGVVIYGSTVGSGSLGNLVILASSMIVLWLMMARAVSVLTTSSAGRPHKSNSSIALQLDISTISSWARTQPSSHTARPAPERRTQCSAA